MYLKEIEILGFKSFAEKITINLDNNITCIVGPNGSGKSNIVDAIRWVLGEQSVKSLRGDNLMSDVIFSGSKSRNQLNVASVMLTFDNTDHSINLPYNTISIKRRVYRTGENEYFLNGEKCRLKDITELFLDTGIGKNSFNIISQGEISHILSSSSQERRFIIEEAAGILKYKSRREEALRKLDKTLNNIERVNDIINELEGRVNPLKEQSDKAIEYLEYKNKLKEVEVGLLVHEIDEINNKYQDNKNQIEKLNNEIISLNTLINNGELEENKSYCLQLEKEISKLNNELLNLTKEEEELNGKRQIILERSKYDAKDIKVHENISLLKEKELSLNNEIVFLEKDINNLQEDIIVSKKNVDTLLNLMTDIKIKKDNYTKEYTVKNKDYLEKINQMNILKDNLENNLSINSNVKRILNNPRLSGICDVFGNILNTSSEYSKALEVIISGSKNFVITENEISAKEAINFLKNNNLGRVTFFPLNVIKPKMIDEDTLNIIDKELDYLGTLASFTKYDMKYQDIVLNQLGNILVCRDLDSANKISKLIHNRYKIVTLDGEIIHVGGSMTGGNINNTISPISIKNELNELKIKTDNLHKVLEELNSNIDKYNKEIIQSEEDVYNAKSEYIRLNELLHNNEKNLQEKKDVFNNIKYEISNLNNLDGNLSKEEDEINNLYFKKQEEKELLVKELNRLKNDYDKLKGKILNLEGEEKVQNNSLKEKEKLLKNLEIDLNRMDLKLDNNLNILNNDYEMTYEKAKDEYILEIDPKDAIEEVNRYKTKIKNIGMVNLLAIDEFKEVNTRYEFLTNQRDDLLNAKETLYSIIDEMDDIMKEDFKNTFIELEIEFKKVFKELFKGGNASLKLTDPDNLLETGVDIIASPPGKSLKAISLLSGGEKTLTAISLLFSILNIRKVPFCIFDEVEAALDENNVDVFGHYLDNYQNKTQFLLITHKKRTMEYAKTLYGITMQESGVSKLVSVKLEG